MHSKCWWYVCSYKFAPTRNVEDMCETRFFYFFFTEYQTSIICVNLSKDNLYLLQTLSFQQHINIFKTNINACYLYKSIYWDPDVEIQTFPSIILSGQWYPIGFSTSRKNISTVGPLGLSKVSVVVLQSGAFGNGREQHMGEWANRACLVESVCVCWSGSCWKNRQEVWTVGVPHHLFGELWRYSVKHVFLRSAFRSEKSCHISQIM